MAVVTWEVGHLVIERLRQERRERLAGRLKRLAVQKLAAESWDCRSILSDGGPGPAR